jgi:hypothetical protein
MSRIDGARLAALDAHMLHAMVKSGDTYSPKCGKCHRLGPKAKTDFAAEQQARAAGWVMMKNPKYRNAIPPASNEDANLLEDFVLVLCETCKREFGFEG